MTRFRQLMENTVDNFSYCVRRTKNIFQKDLLSIECFSEADNRMFLTGQITQSESPNEHVEHFTAAYRSSY